MPVLDATRESEDFRKWYSSTIQSPVTITMGLEAASSSTISLVVRTWIGYRAGVDGALAEQSSLPGDPD